MTRSRRHTPIMGHTTAVSDRPSKTIAHRAERAATRAALAADGETPHRKAFGDPCQSDKDGKQYLKDPKPEWLRK